MVAISNKIDFSHLNLMPLLMFGISLHSIDSKYNILRSFKMDIMDYLLKGLSSAEFPLRITYSLTQGFAP